MSIDDESRNEEYWDALEYFNELDRLMLDAALSERDVMLALGELEHAT